VAVVALTAIVSAVCTPKFETVLVVKSISAVDTDGEPVGELFSDVCEGFFN
jgi:hypothetical protein